MAGYYKVELGALARLTTQLGECGDTMRSAMQQLKDIGPDGSGYAELEAACDEFQNKWGYGIGLIADVTAEITQGLSETRKVYETLEEQIAEAFKAGGK
ncbi:hypothetical protein M2160_002431 [Streptomyces sp. SAI-117]|uniref:hypothetical protein n=1 Tax=Streptomyces sp. SAI-117 TaxID=2940546 RepID=UPI002474CB41|nr:hypothetical protein [Streptomyces sp. SAI-117]MDH6567410.1 hypothetical protein [Streptomyces sp. SAI-117]